MQIKELVVEAIAQVYCTTAAEVANDTSAMPLAEDHLNAFCNAMKEAGY